MNDYYSSDMKNEIKPLSYKQFILIMNLKENSDSYNYYNWYLNEFYKHYYSN